MNWIAKLLDFDYVEVMEAAGGVTVKRPGKGTYYSSNDDWATGGRRELCSLIFFGVLQLLATAFPGLHFEIVGWGPVAHGLLKSVESLGEFAGLERFALGANLPPLIVHYVVSDETAWLIKWHLSVKKGARMLAAFTAPYDVPTPAPGEVEPGNGGCGIVALVR